MATEVEPICVEILMPSPLVSREEGEKVLRLWEVFLPEYLPDKFGNSEPIDQTFNLNNREAILDRWKWPFLAMKRKPKMEASIWSRKGNALLHASWKLIFRFGEADVAKLCQFLRAAAKEMKADFSCMTLFTQSEIDFGRRNRTAWNLDKKATKFQFAVYSQDLHKCLPDVYWTTIFGEPYVSMFGKDKLLSAPVYRAEALSDSLVCIQLTESLENVRVNPLAFAEAKMQLKSFLGEDAFFRVGKLGLCKRPDFKLK